MKKYARYGAVALMMSPLWVAVTHAQNVDFEFDPQMLMHLPNQSVIDIRRFNRSGAVSAGKYRLDIYVNNQWRGVSEVLYQDDFANPQNNANACIDINLLNKLDIKSDIKTAVLHHKDENDCYNLEAVVNHVGLALDVSTLRLNISLPQAVLQEHPHDYTDPALWSGGVSSAFLSYQFNHYHTNQNNNKDSHESYLGLNTGLNVGRWHLRHQGSLRSNSNNSQDNIDYQALNTYLNTDVPTLQSQLTLGDFYSDGTLFEGNAMRGLQFASDDRMLPASLQGYAPIIRGVANSNAKVSIFQNNHEIYSTTVPVGAFELTNIKDIGSSGDLTVVVTEADGRQSKQIVSYSDAISLLRPNRHRHTLSMGRIRSQRHTYEDIVLQGTWQQGLSNYWTLNSGVIYSPQYQSALLGSAVHTRLGSFAINAIGAKAHLHDQSAFKGHQLRLQYHRFLPNSRTNIHASARYYKDYQTLEQVLHSRDVRQNGDGLPIKYRYQLSVSQPISQKYGSLYALFNRTAYKNEASQSQWQLGYNNHIGRFGYSLSAQASKLDGKRWDRQYFVNISLPLGGEARHHFNGFYTNTQDGHQHQIGLSGQFENLPYTDYGLNVSHHDDSGQIMWSGNVNHQSPYARLSASYGDYGDDQQYSLGASGAVVLHQGGLTGASHLGETFAIAHLPNGLGATLNGVDNVVFNRKGYAIFPNLTPYRMNTLTVNPQGLPYHVQLTDTGSQVIPVANASVLVKFDSTIGRMALFNIKLANGHFPVMGAQVLDGQAREVGFVAQDGRVFLQNAQDSGMLQVRWGDDEISRCQFDYVLPDASNLPMVTIDAVCH